MDLLLIIRGLAAISVVVWHAVGYQAGFPFVNIPGRTAVWIFFGISGYVIAHGFLYQRYLLDRFGLKHFYLNRVLRIYPLFLLLSVLGWLTMWAGSGINPLKWEDLPSQFFGIQFNHAYKLNGVFWTLGLEIQFYVIAPALAKLFFISNSQRRWTIIFAGYVGSLVFNLFAVLNLGWSADGRNIISVFPHFFIGMVGCGLATSLKRSNPRAVAFLVCAAICLVASNWLYHTQPAWFWSPLGTILVDAMVLSFIFAHASLAVSLHPPGATHSKLISVFLWMGTLSYGIYAWHAYLMSSFAWVHANLVALLLASIASAYVTYRWVELPALKLKRWQGVEGQAETLEVSPGAPSPYGGTNSDTRQNTQGYGREIDIDKEKP